jgi:hypothetical protein
VLWTLLAQCGRAPCGDHAACVSSNLVRNFSPGSTGSVASTEHVRYWHPTQTERGAEHESKNNPEHDEEARGKSAYSCGLSAGRGVGGLGVSGAPLQPGYTHRLVVLPGGLGNLGRPTEPRFQWIAAKHHIDKFDEMIVMMFLFFQAKERSKRQGGSSWWSPRPTIICPMELHVQNAMTG